LRWHFSASINNQCHETTAFVADGYFPCLYWILIHKGTYPQKDSPSIPIFFSILPYRLLQIHQYCSSRFSALCFSPVMAILGFLHSLAAAPQLVVNFLICMLL
jgi:hypothetical protein